MNKNKYIPENCVWELTLQCNMNCLHCGSKAGKARKNELSINEALDVADQLIDIGCKHLTFIGGEIFLYNEWEKIARRLTDNDVATNIITNAFLMNDKQIDQIMYANLANVGISIDGMEKKHNMIRNNPASFQRVRNAIERLRKENISIAVVTTLVDDNFYDLEEMYIFFKEHDIKIWQIQIATPMGNMAARKDFLLNPDKVPLITRFIRDKRKLQGLRLYAGDDIGYFDENEMYLRNEPGTISVWGGCQAGLKVVGIDSVGNVKGCESLYSDYFIEGNLREEPLEVIWNKEGNFSYNREFDISQLTGHCAKCDKVNICRGGCRGSCYFSSKMLYENPYCSLFVSNKIDRPGTARN